MDIWWRKPEKREPRHKRRFDERSRSRNRSREEIQCDICKMKNHSTDDCRTIYCARSLIAVFENIDKIRFARLSCNFHDVNHLFNILISEFLFFSVSSIQYLKISFQRHILYWKLFFFSVFYYFFCFFI